MAASTRIPKSATHRCRAIRDIGKSGYPILYFEARWRYKFCAAPQNHKTFRNPIFLPLFRAANADRSIGAARRVVVLRSAEAKGRGASCAQIATDASCSLEIEYTLCAGRVRKCPRMSDPKKI